MRGRVTGVGVAVAAIFVAGAVVFFVASGRTAGIGGIVAVLAVAFVAADQLPVGLGGGWVMGKGRRGRTDRPAAEPEYIERAGVPSEDVWRAEQERYQQSKGAGDESGNRRQA